MCTIFTHQGQETFQVPIIGYINSVAYVQREIVLVTHAVDLIVQHKTLGLNKPTTYLYTPEIV